MYQSRLGIWYNGYPLFIFNFHRNTEELHIIYLFWPLCSFIIDFLHQLFLMATLDQWVQPSSFKGSQGLFVVLTNYWSNLFFIQVLVLERLFCVRWIYLHCVCHQEAPNIPKNDFQGSMQSLEFTLTTCWIQFLLPSPQEKCTHPEDVKLCTVIIKTNGGLPAKNKKAVSVLYL